MFDGNGERDRGKSALNTCTGGAQGELSWNEKLGLWDPDKGLGTGGALLEKGPAEYQIRCYLEFCGFPRHPISAAGIYAPISMKCHKT